jgi:hypothetical protein|tara:strand:- start:7659 stop:7853 length:195 start_codon:yes stop_codon:yes gene_type:complete
MNIVEPTPVFDFVQAKKSNMNSERSKKSNDRVDDNVSTKPQPEWEKILEAYCFILGHDSDQNMK